MIQDITPKQKEILNFIELFQRDHGKSPTFNEIKEHFGFGSLNSVFKHIKALEKKEIIKRTNEARGIELLDSVKNDLFSQNTVEEKTLPLVGSIPAGSAVIEDEYVVDQLSITDYLIKDTSHKFLLKVKGDSINKTGIVDSDIVIIDQKKQPHTGDIVAALVDNESTLKIFEKDKNGQIHLLPYSTNTSHTEVIPENEMYIQGVVIGSFRKY